MSAELLYPILSVSALALIFGALLGFASKKFAVEIDPKVEQVMNALPKANCGGCGFPGCGLFAEAVVKETAGYNDCPVGGASVASEIAKTMGAEPVVSERKVAFIKCNGRDDNVKRNYIYDGLKSCVAASHLAGGGSKSCAYSCIGFGSCENACMFDAVKIENGTAVIIEEKCLACGKCVTACPKNLIEMAPEKSGVRVLCNSKDTGGVTRANCRVGCIGCKACQKLCKAEAITIENNLARIDYEKCVLCMECVNKCPVKAIKARLN